MYPNFKPFQRYNSHISFGDVVELHMESVNRRFGSVDLAKHLHLPVQFEELVNKRSSDSGVEEFILFNEVCSNNYLPFVDRGNTYSSRIGFDIELLRWNVLSSPTGMQFRNLLKSFFAIANVREADVDGATSV